MKTTSAVLGMAAAAAFAGASFSAVAAPCPSSAHLSTYLSGGANATCTVLDKTIRGMSLTNVAPANFIDPMFFPEVEPLTVINKPGLAFASMGSAIATGPNTFTITYTITAPSTNPITDASLIFTGFLFTSPPTSSFQVSEMLSNGASLFASNSSTTDSVTFAPTTSSHCNEFGRRNLWAPGYSYKSVFGDPCPGTGAIIVGSARRRSLGARFASAAKAFVVVAPSTEPGVGLPRYAL